MWLKIKTYWLGAWAYITRQDLVYVKANGPFSNTFVIHVKIAYKKFDPFDDGELPLIINMYGSRETLFPDGTTSHGDKWCYVNLEKRMAQRLSWS